MPSDRKKLKNSNGLILGTPGSGKSFAAKREMANVMLSTDDGIIVCYPEGEYSPLVEKFGGQVIKVSPNSNQYINPMDINQNYEYSIAYSLDEIRPRYKWNESCQGSVPAAMRCFYESSDYESFIRNVFSLECDSDTFGAIAGGVAEEFYGGFGGVDVDGLLKKYLTPELWEILNM